MYESERGPNPPVGWAERLIFWIVLFPASLAAAAWIALLGYVCWFGGPSPWR